MPDISAVADPATGAIVVEPVDGGEGNVTDVVGGTSLASPIVSGIWALAQEAAKARLGQAAPILATLPVGAIKDVQPVTATRSDLHGSVTQADGSVTTYNPAQTLVAPVDEATGWVGIGVLSTTTPGELKDLGFGLDTSLMTAVGWDNVTGYGVPNGLKFVRAAAAAAAK